MVEICPKLPADSPKLPKTVRRQRKSDPLTEQDRNPEKQKKEVKIDRKIVTLMLVPKCLKNTLVHLCLLDVSRIFCISPLL